MIAAASSKLDRYTERARTDETIRDVDLWRLCDRASKTVEERVALFARTLASAGRRQRL